MTDLEPVDYMRKALELAKLALGYTTPNPAVGCVIVKDGEIVGTGYHRQAGTPHAEVWALREAGDKAKGATVYVTAGTLRALRADAVLRPHARGKGSRQGRHRHAGS